MPDEHSVEIVCPACGDETLLLRKPVYDGFAKVGEALSCSGCGHVFLSEEDVPFKEQRRVEVFTDADRPEVPTVFKGDEVKFCRHCRHYVLNPFTQWCGVHNKEVAAASWN